MKKLSAICLSVLLASTASPILAGGPTWCGAGTECILQHSDTTTFTLPSGTNTAATLSSSQTLDNKKVGLQSGTTATPSLFFESSTTTGASLVSGNVFSVDVLGFPTMEFGSFGTATNYWLAQPGSTGVNVQLSAKGSDTNVGMSFIAQGTGNLYFAASGVTQFNIPGVASAANYFQPSAATAGNAPQLQVLGSDTNISIELKTKGSGVTDTPTGYTAGVNGTTTGTLGLANGGGSGAYTTVQPSAVTSATTITLPASTGTLALTSGSIATATNLAGGAANDIVIQTATGTTGFVAPVNGAVLNTNSSGTPSETANPVLGVNASVTGTLGLANGGGSGATTTVQPAAVTSSATITLPSATATLAGLGLAQTWTGTQTFSVPIAITPDSSVTPDIAFGGGTSVSNFIAFSGGRSMIGYDSGYTGGGASGAVVLAGGTGKGLEIFTGGTNGTFPSNGGAFTITPGGLVTMNEFTIVGTTLPANGMYIPSPNTPCFTSNTTQAGCIDPGNRLLWGYSTDQGGHELLQVNSGAFINGKVTATNLLDSGLSASAPVVSTDASKNLTTTAPTQTSNTIYAGPSSGGAASPTFRALVTADMPSGFIPILSGTSGSIGGGALLAGACSSGTATVTGATTSMVALVDPSTYPGDGAYWDGYVSSANTITVKVCATVALTPTASTYNVRVLQ